MHWSYSCLVLSHHATLKWRCHFWSNFHHWLHWKLSCWQLPVQPVMRISSKCWHFHFNVYTCMVSYSLSCCVGPDRALLHCHWAAFVSGQRSPLGPDGQARWFTDWPGCSLIGIYRPPWTVTRLMIVADRWTGPSALGSKTQPAKASKAVKIRGLSILASTVWCQIGCLQCFRIRDIKVQLGLYMYQSNDTWYSIQFLTIKVTHQSEPFLNIKAIFPCIGIPIIMIWQW